MGFHFFYIITTHCMCNRLYSIMSAVCSVALKTTFHWLSFICHVVLTWTHVMMTVGRRCTTRAISIAPRSYSFCLMYVRCAINRCRLQIVHLVLMLEVCLQLYMVLVGFMRTERGWRHANWCRRQLCVRSYAERRLFTGANRTSPKGKW